MTAGKADFESDLLIGIFDRRTHVAAGLSRAGTNYRSRCASLFTSVYVAAPIFQVSVSYIYKALGRRERTGETSARPWAGGPKPKLAAHDDALRARVMGEADATLAELLNCKPGSWQSTR